MTHQRLPVLKAAVLHGKDGEADHEHSDGIDRRQPWQTGVKDARSLRLARVGARLFDERLACRAARWHGPRERKAEMADEDYVYDEASGEWLPASELAARRTADDQVEVRDAVGNLLRDGDQVTLIKDLDVKGAGQTLKRGTLIKSIRLTGDPQEIDCKYEGIKGLVLRAEFVRKR
jgi:protein PhnA